MSDPSNAAAQPDSMPMLLLLLLLPLVATTGLASEAGLVAGSDTQAASAAAPATLAEAVAGALQQAGQLIRADALRGEADAVRRQASAWTADDPALRLKGVSDRLTGDEGAYELEALVELPLWLPGQRRVRLELASSLGLRAEALARLVRWEVAGTVRDAVWAAKLAEVQLQQARAAYEAAQGLESVVAKRYDAGELARLDLLTAQQETLARQAELSAARADWEQTQAVYAQITGRLRLPEPPNWPTALPAVVSQRPEAYSDHPLLAEADAALARARAERAQVISDRRGNPDLLT